jgi:hypothetical protein
MDVESSKAELSKLGTQALQDLYNNLTQVKNFALEQAPDVLQQWVHREIVGDLFLAGIGLLLMIYGSIVFFVIRNKMKKNGKDITSDDACFFGSMLLSFAPFIVGIIMTIVNVYQALLVYVAPKVFLIEQIRHLL